MSTPESFHGIIHGRTIELSADPGLREGEPVEVQLRKSNVANAWGEGLRRAAGAFAESWSAADDQILAQLEDDRAHANGRELPQ
jgi:hypothetical protein